MLGTKASSSSNSKNAKKKLKTSKEQMIQEALTSRILKEGWLNKRGGSVKTWKRRYFVIREHKCYYYKEQLTQKLAMRGVQPMGQVDFAVIASVDEVTAADIKGEKKGQEYFKLSVNTGRGFYLITAPSAEQKAQWMSAFREALALYKKNEDMWQARAEGTYDPFADPEKIRLRAISLSPPTPTSSAADLNDEDSEDDSSEEDIQPELPEELYAAGLTDESDAVEAMRAEELYKAVVSRRYPVVKALLGLRTGVTWCSADHGNRTALHVAAELRDRVALQLLLPHLTGSLHHITCDMAWTPLHYAALAGSSECFALLLQAGRAQVRAQDRDGRTPTYLALIAGHPKIVEQCLQADMEGGDSQWTAAHLAILRGDVPSYITEVSSTPRLFTNSFPFALTLMHFAACSGSVPLLQILADSNCFHIDCLDQFSKTPLHIAANAGRVPAIQFLLKQGARVVAIDSRQKTPLHFAAGRNSLEGCQALLEAGCAVGALDEYLFSAIHTAAAHGAAPELMALLVKKSLPDAANMQGACGYTPLLLAVHAGHLETAKSLIQLGALVDKVTHQNHTPLHEASSRGYHLIAQMLLEHGANPNALDSRGYSPIHHAVSNGRSESLEVLLHASADPNLLGANSSTDESPNTPLCLAIALENEKVVCQLLDAGAIPDKSVRGSSPLHRSVDMKHSKIVRALIDARHPLDVLDDTGLSPLVLAVRLRAFDIVHLLLDSGAQSDFPAGPPGWRPLHEAVSNDDLPMVELLLSKGPDPNVADAVHRVSPLHLAASRGHFDITSRLLAAGADGNLADDCGNKPVHYATAGSHSAVALLLCSNPSISLSDRAAALLREFLTVIQGEYTQSGAGIMAPVRASTSNSAKIESPSSATASKTKLPTGQPPKKLPSVPPPTLPESSLRKPRPGSGFLDTSPIAAPAAEASIRPPRRRETITMQYNAKQYIQQAQQRLSKDQYLYFQAMLRDYKSKHLDINELIQKVIDLFRETEQDILMRDFVQFIPDRYKDAYSDKVSALLDPVEG